MENKMNIIYEDEYILVIDKPSGLVVNRSNTYDGETLQDVLEKKYEFGDSDSEFKNRSGIVHRLDKGTSGCLVIAKDEESFLNLQKQFKERKVEKEYVALVNGRVGEEVIEVDAPIGRSPNNPLKFSVVSSGRAALTKIEKIKDVEIDGNEFSLLKINPKTGRTHQIRVHLSALNHPVVSDILYCSKKLLEMNRNVATRLMLHSRFLNIFHPKTQKNMRFEAPLPNLLKL
jgi:23S rRNA pseudouridine1911/1915/1917 synthase